MRYSPATAHCIRYDVLLCGHVVVIWYCSENGPGMYPVPGLDAVWSGGSCNSLRHDRVTMGGGQMGERDGGSLTK